MPSGSRLVETAHSASPYHSPPTRVHQSSKGKEHEASETPHIAYPGYGSELSKYVKGPTVCSQPAHGLSFQQQF